MNAEPEPFAGVEIDRVFLSRAELSAPWGIDMPPMTNVLLFHLVVEGEAWIRFHQRKTRYAIPRGVLALVPHGRGHLYYDGECSEMTPLFDIPRRVMTGHYEVMEHGGGGATSLTLCGAVKLSHPLSGLLLNGVPDIVVVQEWHEHQEEWVRSTFGLIFAEAKSPDFASKEIIMHLSEVLVFQAIRHWFSSNKETLPFMKAMSDRRISRVISSVQSDPQRKWSTLDLAKLAGMSRSAFTGRFSKLVGVHPSDFVRNTKMSLAEKYFRQESSTIGEVAWRLGYESEAAFARAYKRVMGVSPGKIKGRAEQGI